MSYITINKRYFYPLTTQGSSDLVECRQLAYGQNDLSREKEVNQVKKSQQLF